MEDFTRELAPGNTKAAMKAVGAAGCPPYGYGIGHFGHDGY